jgi:hypothetical protein
MKKLWVALAVVITGSLVPVASASAATTVQSAASAVPYASALSSYKTLAQSYSAKEIVADNWAGYANDSHEGNGTCPAANTTYSSSLNAVVLTTTGQPTTVTTACAHIRSQHTVPTSGDVIEAKVYLPGLSSAQTFGGTKYPAGTLMDWATMWLNGANTTNGAENWPADTEIDPVETQYGTNYLTVHYGTRAANGDSTGNWTTLPQGWAGAGAIYATPNTGVPNIHSGWNVVDFQFTSTVANIYFNGERYITIPASALSHKPAYLNFGVSGPNGGDPNNATWPSGHGTEEVQYVKVFS